MDSEEFINALKLLNKKATNRLGISDEKDSLKINIITNIIDQMVKRPKEWKELCSYNEEIFKDRIIKQSSWAYEISESNLDEIFCIFVRFCCEYELFGGRFFFSDFRIEEIMEKILQIREMESENSLVRKQINMAFYTMPAQILNKFLKKEEISYFKNFEEKRKAAISQIEGWRNELKQKESRVEELKNKLEGYEEAFNFVGLNKGFLNLNKKKITESRIQLITLILMAISAIAPLFYAIFFTWAEIQKGQTFTIEHIAILLPLISLEIILVYFFRVILFSYQSAKTQIMQIELRMTLCQFIQSYSNYAIDIKEKDKAALDKFENLIFSNILSDSNNLPSTFDGIEQIGNIVKNFKSN